MEFKDTSSFDQSSETLTAATQVVSDALQVPGNATSQASGNAAPSDRPQPIFIKSLPNYRDLLAQLSELSTEKFDKKAIVDLLRITPSSIDQYRFFQNYLSVNNIQFYAMKPKAERPKKVVIRGLPTDTDISDLKKELSHLEFAVHRISPMRHFKTKQPYPNFICDRLKNNALPGVVSDWKCDGLPSLCS